MAKSKEPKANGAALRQPLDKPFPTRKSMKAETKKREATIEAERKAIALQAKVIKGREKAAKKEAASAAKAQMRAMAKTFKTFDLVDAKKKAVRHKLVHDLLRAIEGQFYEIAFTDIGTKIIEFESFDAKSPHLPPIREQLEIKKNGGVIHTRKFSSKWVKSRYPNGIMVNESILGHRS